MFYPQKTAMPQCLIAKALAKKLRSTSFLDF